MKVSALGGTVTAGGGAGGTQHSYAGRVHSWLLSLGSDEQPANIIVSNVLCYCLGAIYILSHHLPT